MTDSERDKLILETHQDIKWIKTWIAEQNKYKLLAWSALIAAMISLAIH